MNELSNEVNALDIIRNKQSIWNTYDFSKDYSDKEELNQRFVSLINEIVESLRYEYIDIKSLTSDVKAIEEVFERHDKKSGSYCQIMELLDFGELDSGAEKQTIARNLIIKTLDEIVEFEHNNCE